MSLRGSAGQLLAVAAAAAVGPAPAVAVRPAGRLGPARLHPQHARHVRPRQRWVSSASREELGGYPACFVVFGVTGYKWSVPDCVEVAFMVEKGECYFFTISFTTVLRPYTFDS